MIISLSWLNQYVPVNMSVAELTEALTMAGLEVDSVTDRYAWLDGVRVGEIVSVAPHPNADKLKLCEVEIGEASPVRVVCGAPNAEKGMKAPLALPGTEFPDGRVLEMGVIRGEKSNGMLCSAVELALGDDASGLMVLDPALETGAPLAEALKLSDRMIEVDLTPNRPDCLSIIGIAREVAGYQRLSLTYPPADLPDGEKDIRKLASVTIEDPDHCPRYAARLLENVTVGPSPAWLQDRLLSVGLRPINNIVDVTNFVMMETGQPLHAFDFDRLAGGAIVVRTADPDEVFTTLDGKARKLADDMLMIRDAERSVAVAGVMGGLNSEIDDNTNCVLIESAYFDPVSVRRTARRLGLATDASHRFERGVDPEGTCFALDRAARLMVEVSGATLINGCIDERPRVIERRTILLNASAVNARLGTDIPATEMVEILSAIEFEVQTADADTLRVTPPSCRVDVSRPEDLMEEIARIWGYNRIPVTFPSIPAKGVPMSPRIMTRNRIKEMMAGFGFTEAITYSFISSEACDRLRLPESSALRRTVNILNPISEDQNVMRTSLIPGLLETVRYNLAHQNRTLKLFETGKIFLSDGADTQPDEPERLAAVWTGLRSNPSWFGEPEAVDFYDLKGTVEELLAGFNIKGIRFTALADAECYQTRPGRTAAILHGDEVIGLIGEAHPKTLAAFDIKQPLYLFEFDLEALPSLVGGVVQAEALPKFPPVSRDITLVVDRETEAADLIRSILDMNEALVEDVSVFAVYGGERIPEGKKSISIRLVYRSAEGTLEDDAVTALHQNISGMLLERFDARFPGS